MTRTRPGEWAWLKARGWTCERRLREGTSAQHEYRLSRGRRATSWQDRFHLAVGMAYELLHYDDYADSVRP